jgi:pimeloyl-ACP methyl ester carboxylesterase
MPTPLLLIPGLNCTARVFSALIPPLWSAGPVMVADHRQGSTIAEIAASILESAPPRFHLGGFSMGGYIALEIMRWAPQRVAKLALIDTSARPDTPEQSERRREAIAIVNAGGLDRILNAQFPLIVDPAHKDDKDLLEIHLGMGRALGAKAFVRHSEAIITRPDSRPSLAELKCPTAIVVGESDKITPPDAAEEMAGAISGAKLTRIPSGGPQTPLEQPQAVAEAVLELLRSP